MFTGIIEHLAPSKPSTLKRDGGRVAIHAPSLAPSLAVSNSIAVNGCCLTIVVFITAGSPPIYPAKLSAKLLLARKAPV